jgi:hypothetical protein
MTGLNRRALLGASAAALAGVSAPAFAAWPEAGHGMPMESADTPHICLGPIADAEINPAGIRRYTQIGLTHIILNGAGYPWDGDMGWSWAISACPGRVRQGPACATSSMRAPVATRR